MKVLKIEKGFFENVGEKYGWVKDGFHPHGVGINTKHLTVGEEFRVVVQGETYKVDVMKAISFSHYYKSVMPLGKGVSLRVVSKSILEKI
jgi:hypothetical protein